MMYKLESNAPNDEFEALVSVLTNPLKYSKSRRKKESVLYYLQFSDTFGRDQSNKINASR